MEYISTSALANELDIKSPDLFEKLNALGWISKNNKKWVLTEIGKMQGGKMYNAKFGEYIVWPEGINIDIGQQKGKPKLINATAIGKHFRHLFAENKSYFV